MKEDTKTYKCKEAKKYDASKSAFTLAEMMVVLLILSLVMAAFLPVITKKSKTPTGIWQYSANNADAYFGLGATQGVAVGANTLSGNNTRLLLQTSSPDQSAMVFYDNTGTRLGRLVITGANAGSTYGKSTFALGGVALGANTTGYNTAVGLGVSNTGSFSTAYGFGASSFDNSVAIGSVTKAGSATTGLSVAVGANANASGNNSTAVGSTNSGVQQASGAGSTALGAMTLASGINSAVVGYSATDTIGASTGDYAVAIGSWAKSSGDCALAIGDTANATGYSALAIGRWTIGSGDFSISIGNTDTTGNTKATGKYSIAMGYLAQATSTGNVSVGAGALTTGSAGAVAVGNGAGASGLRSSALGYQANASGNASIAIGSWNDALSVVTTATGTHSLAIGVGALTQCDDSIAMGYNAVGKNTVGETSYVGSVAIGSGTTADGGGIAIGDTAHANSKHSIAIGPNTTATGNTSVAIGNAANSSVAGETIIGSTAHSGGGGFGTAIGYNASVSYQATAVGNNASAADWYTLALGVNTSASPRGCVAIGADSLGTGAQATATDQFVLGTLKHHVNIPGDLQVGKDGGNFFGSTGTWKTTSDKRLKNLTGDFIDGLDKIRQLQPYNYTFKKDKEKTPRVGIMAQDLQKVFPDAVSKGKDGYLMIRQEDMFYAMINSIKQLDKIVQGIIEDVKALVARVQKVEDKVAALINSDRVQSKEIQALKTKNAQLESRIKHLEKDAKAQRRNSA